MDALSREAANDSSRTDNNGRRREADNTASAVTEKD